MTNEEFQNLVLKELGSIKADVSGLKEDVISLKQGQARIEVRLERVETKLDAVHDQTAVLTEFRTDTNTKLDYLLEENMAMHEIIGRHEIAISTLKRKAV